MENPGRRAGPRTSWRNVAFTTWAAGSTTSARKATTSIASPILSSVAGTGRQADPGPLGPVRQDGFVGWLRRGEICDPGSVGQTGLDRGKSVARRLPRALDFAEHDFGGVDWRTAALSADVRAGAATRALSIARTLAPDSQPHARVTPTNARPEKTAFSCAVGESPSIFRALRRRPLWMNTVTSWCPKRAASPWANSFIPVTKTPSTRAASFRRPYRSRSRHKPSTGPAAAVTRAWRLSQQGNDRVSASAPVGSSMSRNRGSTSGSTVRHASLSSGARHRIGSARDFEISISRSRAAP